MQLVPINDRVIPRRAERQEDARGDSQTEMNYPRETLENQLGRAAAQPRMIDQAAEAVERHQQELEGGNHTDEAAANNDSRSILFAGSGEIPILAAAPTTARIPAASSLSLSAPSRLPSEQLYSSRALGDSGGATSTLSPLDAYERPSPNPRSGSISPDEPSSTPQSGSPSRHRQSALHALESNRQQAHNYASAMPTQPESSAPPVRLRAQLHTRSGSLRTDRSVSDTNYEQLTIVNLESKSETTGELVFFRAKLDTGAMRNAISETIVRRLDMEWNPDCEGITFKVIGNGADAGSVIYPLGSLSLTVRVMVLEKLLRLKFYVLAESDVGRAFDCLLDNTTSFRNFLMRT